MKAKALVSTVVLSCIAFAAGCGSSQGPSSGTAVQAVGGPGAPAARIQCWSPGVINVHLNTDLDPVLERGNGAARLAAFQAAAAEWNRELAAARTGVSIAIVDTQVAQAAAPEFAFDWGNQACATAPQLVYVPDFLGGDAHSGNGVSAASFGHQGANVGRTPGWTANTDRIESFAVDRLAETLNQKIANGIAPNVDRITETDVAFHTHEAMGCSQIPWFYAGGPGVAVPPNDYDYYSVALHELGHSLGLYTDGTHAAADGLMPGNVMRPMIQPGQQLSINATEIAALVALYAACVPAGAAQVPPPPANQDPPPALNQEEQSE